MTDTIHDPDDGDDGFRILLARNERLTPTDAEVDASWERLVRTVRAERRRRRSQLAVAAAAIVLVASTVGRSTVVSGGQALVRFVTDAAVSTVDGAADAIVDRIDQVRGAPSSDLAHGSIDDDNEFWVAVRVAHDQLNATVGWGRWRPDELDDAAERLRAAAPLDAALGPRALEAAEHIERAKSNGSKQAAIQAHRDVAAIEMELQVRKQQADDAARTTTTTSA